MAYGLHPVRNANGGTLRTNNFCDYKIADDYNTALYRGDPVIVVADGTIAKAIGDEGTESTTTIVGVFWGCDYTPDTGAYSGVPVFDSAWPASQSIQGSYANAMVYDDPNTIFKCQSDQVSTAFTQASVFAGTDFTWVAGNALLKTSGVYVNSDSPGALTDGQLRIVGTAEDDGTWSAAGTAMDILVMIDEGFWVNRPASI
tara:strand:+ start:2928 stop:3530 length:603 start_codon:yes stop_codon:yes gene_type:complete